jgi:hypothetical protein
MTLWLENKVAVVTGGSSGIGRATALAFAREGAKVVIGDVAVEGGQETVRLIEKVGGQAIFVRTDVSKAADVQALVNRTIEAYSRLDCAFNNAGVGRVYGAEVLTREGHYTGVVLNPLIGETKSDDVDAATRMRTYMALIDNRQRLGLLLTLRVLEESQRMARESVEGQAIELGHQRTRLGGYLLSLQVVDYAVNSA